MKVLFLDIDGVLNSERTTVANDTEDGRNKFKTICNSSASRGYLYEATLMHLDPISVKLINKLCEDTQCKIVVSSTHRQNHRNREALKEYMTSLGVTGEVIDGTPALYTIRGAEIKRWLESNPDVTQYAIVDDGIDMLPEQEDFFVRVDPLEGLSYANFTKLRRILSENR